jgi:SAM-dependent methyltransferase
VTEHKLYEGTEPWFSTLPFFTSHAWVSPAQQSGHAQRTAMAAEVARLAMSYGSPATLSDLGCGDGSLLAQLAGLPLRMWGYDAGQQNVLVARARGLDVRQGDILAPGLEYGDLITCCEVAEHLSDPHAFIKALPGRLLVLTSPSAEDAGWHYEHHAWAWDTEGYAAMVTGAGWDLITHVECDGGTAWHGGHPRQQRFQAVLAVRP